MGRMGELLGQEVKLAPDCIGDEVKAIVDGASEGDVIMLENTRFYKEETKNEEGFVEKPMAAIVGGSKVSSKITVLNALLDKCDKIIIGGGMVFTFLKAKGLSVGTSLVEEDFVDTAKEVLAKAEKLGKQILLPSDSIIADKFDADAETKVVSADAIPDGWMGLDNGPVATEEQKEFLSDCKTVIMNGPMGVFEMKAFEKGTFGIVDILADLTRKRALSPSLEEEILLPPRNSLGAPEICHTSLLGGERRWSCWRVRFSLVLPPSMTNEVSFLDSGNEHSWCMM